jgi:transcriptional regulator with XRE-family HTH domain
VSSLVETDDQPITGVDQDAGVDMVRFGRGIRALRIRRRWRQVDLAAAASLSRSTIGRIEVGNGGSIPAGKLDAVAQALGARTDLRLSWNGEALDRLLDSAHAAIVELVVARLRRAAWEVATEVTFWIHGERGSMDVLAWHAAAQIVLVVEVKSVVPDVQGMLSALDRKVRLAPKVARERGWSPLGVSKLLVIGESRTGRRRVAAHEQTFLNAFPSRAIEVRRAIQLPDAREPLRGLLFLSPAHGVGTRHRVRPTRGQR